jgi:hypothetical protein
MAETVGQQFEVISCQVRGDLSIDAIEAEDKNKEFHYHKLL